MLKAFTVVALGISLASPALAQQTLRNQNQPGVQRPGDGIAARAGDLDADERRARQAQILAERDNRQREIDARIQAGEAEIKAIEDKAAQEMRPLTPAESRRVAAINQRIANARKTREALMAAVDDAQEKAKQQMDRERRRRADAIESRREAAGLPGGGAYRRGARGR